MCVRVNVRVCVILHANIRLKTIKNLTSEMHLKYLKLANTPILEIQVLCQKAFRLYYRCKGKDYIYQFLCA